MTGGRTGGPRRRAGCPRIAAWALAAAVMAFLATGCGGRMLRAGTVPFPADKPVVTDGEGRPLRSLPETPEPLKLVVLDFPWCPPCAEAWKAVLAASGALPPGSLRVYRILFDRERFYARNGVSEVPPFRAGARTGPPEADSRAIAVTTLTAIPDAFREQYEVEQAPTILLLSGSGKVARRWTGYSPSLTVSLLEEIRRLGNEGQDSSASPPP